MVRRFFVEHRETVEVHRPREGAPERRRTEDRGLSIAEVRGDRDLEHHWRALPEGGGELPELSVDTRSEAQATLGVRALGEGQEAALAGAAERIAAIGAEAGLGVEVRLREVCQRVLCAGPDGVSGDTRRYAIAEVRAVAPGGEGPKAWVQRERAFGDSAALIGAEPEWRALFAELAPLARARLAPVALPVGPVTVVLPPGADAGVLFHELCGHPLEGDVAARGGSYLARRRGERVGSELLTVVDDPTVGAGALGYGRDDEGAVARRVALLDQGRVAGTLTDRCCAGDGGSNGHGRRVSFRHPALPRMSHTAVAAGRGRLEEIVQGVRRGLLVRYLTPRHIHLLSGAFSFFVVEAQLIEDGRIGGLVPPCILRGDGLTALAGIDAVGEDVAPFFGLKGCGKLDHGPLPVSFGNPTVRIQGLGVTAWS